MADSGCVLLCVGASAPATSTIEFCVGEAVRRGTDLRLVHVLSLGGLPEAEQARAVTVGHARLSLALKRAREVAATRVEVSVLLRHGSVIEGILRAGADAALIVMERPALVTLGGSADPSVTVSVAESAAVPTATVPVLWQREPDEPTEELPPAWVEQGRRPVVTVLLDDPADDRHAVEAAIREADQRSANVEFLHAWSASERPGRAVAEVSAGSALLVVGARADEPDALTAFARAALFESKCPVLVVPTGVDDHEPAAVIPLRRAARL